MSSWPRGIGAITLFVEDLQAARQFYGEVFSLPVKFEDDNSAAFDFGNTIINLLKATAAPELIKPAAVAALEAGSRLQFTIDVDDVDAMCAELAARGVELLNGPMDRPGECAPPASKIPAATSGRSRTSQQPAAERRDHSRVNCPRQSAHGYRVPVPPAD